MAMITLPGVTPDSVQDKQSVAVGEPMENWFFKRLKKWRDRRSEMARGLDCYDPGSRVFPGMVKKIQKGLELSKRDILLILMWKTPFFKKSYSP